ERARLARGALVGRRLTDEVEAMRRARARRVEQVAVARHLVGTLEPCADLAAAVVVEERRRPGAARQRALLEPEQEDDVPVPRPRPHQVDDRNASCLPRRREADLAALERRDQLLPRDGEALELRQELQDMAVRAQVEPRGLAGGRRLRAVGGAEHLAEERPDRLDVVA